MNVVDNMVQLTSYCQAACVRSATLKQDDIFPAEKLMGKGLS